MAGKMWLAGVGGAVIAAGVIGLRGADQSAKTIAAYAAKGACSEIFLARRSADAVLAGEFGGIHPLFDKARLDVDATARSVTGRVYGLGSARAVYREGYGCTIEAGAPVALPPLTLPVKAFPLEPSTAATEASAVAAILDDAMTDPQGGHRALVVFVDGQLVAERYADGFDAATPLLSWSMAKSVTAMMVGAAVARGAIDLDARPPVAAWSKPGDPRGGITWRHLMQMQSGLDFAEDYENPASDVNRMLFQSRSASTLAARSRLAHPPGTHWSYSSGTTNILQGALATALGNAGIDYHSFAREALFAPLGAASVTLEPDSAGVFIGSSFIYATARDWALLGQLHLADGVWNGARLLPEGWTAFVTTPASAADAVYGAQFWLNRDGARGADGAVRPRYIEGLPEDAYLMSGHEGQYVVMLPDRNAVLVRLGQTRGRAPMEVSGPLFAALYRAIDVREEE